jgi:hypothetical protein
VGDQDDRGPGRLLRGLEHLQDLRLDGHVERRGRLVGDDHVGVVGDRHRDHRPLAHTAGELVRERGRPLLRVGDADQVEQFDGLFGGAVLGHVLVDAQRLGDLVAHRVHRCEGRQRVLEDHRDLFAADGRGGLVVERQEFLAAVAGRAVDARVARQQAHDRQRRDGLARPGLADDAEDLAGPDVVGQPAHRGHVAVLGRELDGQILDLEDDLGVGRRRVGGVLVADSGHRVSSFSYVDMTVAAISANPGRRWTSGRARRACRRR